MKLSIITINYQNIDGLEKTMDSVLCQTFTDFEYIVVDGGSDDGAEELLVDYQSRFGKMGISFHWVSEKDNGIYHAMNKGVNMAHGEYCNFLNSGDYYANSQVLEHVFEEYNPHEILIGYAKTETRIIPPPQNISIGFFYNHGSINHQAAFIRKELLVKHPYDETKGLISSDYKFFIEALLVDNCSYRPIDTLVVHFDSNGISSQPGVLEKIRKEQTKALELHYNAAELGDMLSVKYDQYKIVRWSKYIVDKIVRWRKILSLKTYNTNLRVNRNPSKALLFRRMIRTNLRKVKWYFQVGHTIKGSAIIAIQRDVPVIISLTSYPARMNSIMYTLRSLMTQTVKPDKIILWLTEGQYPRREADVPLEILNLRKYGLTIGWYDRPIRSYTKLIPALQQYPDAIIVTADDDIQYRKDWLEGLYKAYLNEPQMVHCYFSHKISMTDDGCTPYNEWLDVKTESTSYDNLLLGVGGVLYPPHICYTDVCHEDLFMECAPSEDDLWFWAMVVMNNSKIHVIHNENSATIPVPNVNNEFALYNENSLGRSDISLQKIISRYPMIKQKL
ncbi:MAG: glycosyltransferase [Paludibacteraceae bacterium]|nr:glycosyltransferase [Paludibacteraceae bacterium]